MSVTMGQILAETEAFIKNSSAQYKKTAGYAPASTVGGDGSGMPGSECDKPINAGAKESNPEVADGLPNTTSGEGTNSEKLEGASALDVTQPVASPSKEPLISSDANAEPKTGAAKTASIANDILASIRGYQTKTAAAPVASAVKPATPAASTPAAPKAPAKVAAAVAPVELTSDVLAKIASVILATEDGVDFAEACLTKAAGAEAAKETLEFLQKQAAYAQGQQDAEAMVSEFIAQEQGAEKQAGAEFQQGQQDAHNLIKLAVHRIQTNRGTARLVKLAQEVADESIGDGSEGAVPAEGSGLPPEMASAPADEEISPEELQQALEELVQEGQITPEAAQSIVDAIQAAEQGGDVGSEGGGEGSPIPPEAMGEEAAPATEELPAEEEAKEAMAKKAAVLVQIIKNQKAARA